MFKSYLLKCIKLKTNYAQIMLDLFKEETHPYNLRNGLICGSYKIKTVRYGTQTINYLGPKYGQCIANVGFVNIS